MSSFVFYDVKSPFSFLKQMKKMLHLLVMCCLTACITDGERRLEQSLLMAGDNRMELERVINHYPAGDRRKQYAEFLIGNMPGHYSYDTTQIFKYRPFLNKLSELRAIEQINGLSAFDSINKEWKEFLKYNDIYHDIYAGIVYDLGTIKSDFLIHDIETAVSGWDKCSWKDSIDDSIFMEEILPYRKSNGYIIENWRERLHNEYKHLLNPDYTLHQQIDTLLDSKNDKTVNGSAFSGFPYICLEDYLEGRISHCEVLCWFNSLLMSSLSIPCAMDYVPAWGNRNGSHMWNALVQKGKTSPFEATGGRGKWKCGKVYNNAYEDEYWFKSRLPKVFRKSYIFNSSNYSEKKLSRFLASPFKFLDKDVSDEYFITSTVTVPVKYETKLTSGCAYLAVFNTDKWVPVFWGDVYNDSVIFRKMGRDIVYLPVFYREGRMIPFNDPFLLDSNGGIHYFCADTSHVTTVKLHRKYCERPDIGLWRRWNENAVVEIADNPEFSNATPILKIPECASHMNSWKLPSPVNSRYIRYVFPEHKDVLAELSFFSNGEQLTGKFIFSDVRLKKEADKLFDNNILTFADFNQLAAGSVWIGFDFGKNEDITEINLCPRNDDNNVVKGRSYELFYWDSTWRSLGRKKAEQNYVVYDNTPANALLMLRCTSGGKENRIFTWSANGQQWW